MVHVVADVPGEARVSLNAEQRAAVAARGVVFVSAGAGTGKTKVLVERIRAGDVEHDPRGGACPTWCELWPMCRVRRA